MKKLTKELIEQMATEIIDLCKREDWGDTSIYFNNKRVSIDYNGDTTEKEDMDPHDYFEWAAYNHILSMSFEGNLYDYLNYVDYDGTKLREIFDKYGVYYELGNAWNLSVFPAHDDMEIEYTVYERPLPITDIYRHNLGSYSEDWINTLIKIYNNAIADMIGMGFTGYGSCVIGDGIEFKKDGKPYKFHTNYNQSEAPREVIDCCKKYLESIGATEIWYNPGTLD